jgi:hypothetical protein
VTTWDACGGVNAIRSIGGVLFRMVESQEQVATMGYVDSLEEQSLLEEMLEQNKPPCPDGADAYHYLLKTPFRYPPLEWGSRFGSQAEPALFYGAASIPTTLAESAYYRFVFWHSIDAEPIKEKLNSEHTLFSVKYKTANGVQLQHPPFDAHAETLTHPSSYLATRQLGSDMREAGVEAFEYLSARDHDRGICTGLFTPAVFTRKEPSARSQWLCEITARAVTYSEVGSTSLHAYPVDSFLVDGLFPLPS